MLSECSAFRRRALKKWSVPHGVHILLSVGRWQK
jgi:hypothetical protein